MLREVRAGRGSLPTEQVPALECAGRILAEEITADRDYPPFARSARDGFAVRAADVPGELHVIGEVRAGEVSRGSVGPRGAVEIMTGAPLPEGADAVVMVEHTERSGDRVKIDRSLKSGENFNAQGIEARQGSVVLSPGRRLGFAEIALLAMVGRECAVGLSPATGRNFADRRRDRRSRPLARALPDPQFERLVHGRAGGQGRWRSTDSADRARQLRIDARVDRTRLGARSALALGRRLRRQVRYRRTSAGRSGREILLRPRAGAARTAVGIWNPA